MACTRLSLWTRNPEIAVLQACRELGVAFVAFSPVARGFFSDPPLDTGVLDAGDLRRTNPRFVGDTWSRNLERLAPFQALARQAGCTPAAFALAWLLARGTDVIPIPGTTRVAHLRENVAAAGLHIEPELLAAAETLFPAADVCGPRYPATSQAEVDTEQYAPPN
jgi:aryl-alcohol dehydrogenase-like predicted oxidoreductase